MNGTGLPMVLALLVLIACNSDDAREPSRPQPLVAVTFNTGTTEGTWGGDYTEQHAAYSDQYYGDGLAWKPAVEAATAFFSEVQPDVVAFQEVFYSGACADVPEEARTDFVCEDHVAGDPTVAQVILGAGYQVMCNPGKDDKCAAVHERLGRFRGCDDDFCLEGMDGYGVEGCGSGARVARAVIETGDGEPITLVTIHGSSGLADADEQCRVRQVDQVFVDLGDGHPGADGERNLVMGDFNTDPGRWAAFDASASAWVSYVTGAFHFVTSVDPDAAPTYGGVASIDHVLSDALSGDCWSPGVDADPVLDTPYFDHNPAVCTVE